MNKSKRFYFLTIFMLGMIFTHLDRSNAKETNYQLMSKDRGEIVQKKILKKAKTIKTIKSDFVQTKYLSVLSEKIVSSGNFEYQANSIRWEYLKPYKYLIVLKDAEIYKKDENDTKLKKQTLAVGSLFKEINDILLKSLRGTLIADVDRFHVELYENHDSYLAKLIPISDKMKKHIGSMNLYFEKDRCLLLKIKILEPSKDYTKITFLNRTFSND